MNKKGISPIIATILILGFTVVLAAVFFTWGSGFFSKAQQDTANTVRLSSVCTEVATNLKLVSSVKILGTNKVLEVAVDNGASDDLTGSIFRVYNVGETVVDTFDTKITTPVKLGVKPKVTVAGKEEICGESTQDI